MHSRIDTPHILIMCISLTAKAFRVHCCLNTKRRWKQNTPPGRGSRIAHGSRDACLCLVPSGSLWLPLVPSVPSGSLWFSLDLLFGFASGIICSPGLLIMYMPSHIHLHANVCLASIHTTPTVTFFGLEQFRACRPLSSRQLSFLVPRLSAMAWSASWGEQEWGTAGEHEWSTDPSAAEYSEAVWDGGWGAAYDWGTDWGSAAPAADD